MTNQRLSALWILFVIYISFIARISPVFALPTSSNSRLREEYMLAQSMPGELATLLSRKGFVVLAVDASNQSNRPLVNANASYIDTNKNGLMDSGDQGFFNPASTIKVMTAALVLEVLNKNQWPITATYEKAGNTASKHVFAKDIESMLVVSDNAATNRLILFLGFEYIASRAGQLGLNNFEINRLMLGKGPAEASPSFIITHSAGSTTTAAKAPPPNTSKATCRETNDIKGNCASASNLISSLRFLLDTSPNNPLVLSPNDRRWVASVMASTPKQLGFDYPDDYCRFLQSLKEDSTLNITILQSKCGVAPYTPTYVDLSRFTLRDNRVVDILIAKRYSGPVDERAVIQEFSAVGRQIISFLRQNDL